MTNSKAIDKDIKLMKDPQYHNPDPLVRLTEDTNETNIVINVVSCKGLVDSGAKTSIIIKSFIKALGLKTIDGLLDIEGIGGMEVSYQGYVEVNLQIQEIGAHNQEDILMLLIPNSKYGTRF